MPPPLTPLVRREPLPAACLPGRSVHTRPTAADAECQGDRTDTRPGDSRMFLAGGVRADLGVLAGCWQGVFALNAHNLGELPGAAVYMVGSKLSHCCVAANTVYHYQAVSTAQTKSPY
eukprot:3387398-Pyramimonas_sp.AAC.1